MLQAASWRCVSAAYFSWRVDEMMILAAPGALYIV